MHVWVVERKFFNGWFPDDGESFSTRELARNRIKQMRLERIYCDFRVRKYVRV